MCLLPLSCSFTLHFMIPLFDASESDERKKAEIREICIEVSVLVPDMKGFDAYFFVLRSGDNCLSHVNALASRTGPCAQPEWLGKNLLWGCSWTQNPSASFKASVVYLWSCSALFICSPWFWNLGCIIGFPFSFCLALSFPFVTAWSCLSHSTGSQILIPLYVWHCECMGWFEDKISLELWIPGSSHEVNDPAQASSEKE